MAKKPTHQVKVRIYTNGPEMKFQAFGKTDLHSILTTALSDNAKKISITRISTK